MPKISELTPRGATGGTSAVTGAEMVATASAGASYRVPLGRPHLNVKAFGATGDGVTNDYAAVRACLDYAKTYGRAVSTITGVIPVYFPPGVYYMGANTLELHACYHLIGEGRGISGGLATELKWDPNTIGIITAQSDSTGASGVSATPLGLADGTIIDGFYLRGGWQTTKVEGEYHGILVRCPTIVRNCLAIDWQGAGFRFAAAAGAPDGADPPRGNCNMSRIEHCRGHQCRDALEIFGSDANQIVISYFQATSSRRHGIYDRSFLGCTFISPMCQEIGRTSENDGVTYPTSMCSYGGQRYYVRPGQAVGASTNAPTGTTADNTWWGRFGAGGPAPTNGCPEWVSGLNVREGWVYTNTNVNNTSVWENPYREGDETVAYFAAAGVMVISGQGFQADSTSLHCRVRGQGGFSAEGTLVARNNSGTNSGWNVQLGTTNNSTFVEVLRFPDGIGSGSAFSMRHSNGDVIWDIGSAGESGPFVATGLATTQQFGTGAIYPRAFYPRNLMIGPSMASARKLLMESVVPSSGAHGNGEIALNKTPNTNGISHWICSVAGTPGTWKAILVAPGTYVVNTASSTTGVIAHQQAHVKQTNAGATTYTVPPNSSVAYEIGATIIVERGGAGTVTITPGAGVTINSRGGLTQINGQYGVVTLRQTATDVWSLSGDLV